MFGTTSPSQVLSACDPGSATQVRPQPCTRDSRSQKTLYCEAILWLVHMSCFSLACMLGEDKADLQEGQHGGRLKRAEQTHVQLPNARAH